VNWGCRFKGEVGRGPGCNLTHLTLRDASGFHTIPVIFGADFYAFIFTGGLRPPDPPKQSAFGLLDYPICIGNPM
jgi:hypothetical protein